MVFQISGMKITSLILLLFSSICLGQNISHISTSDSLLNLGETDLAIDHLNKCIEIHTDEKILFECLATLCNIYKQSSNYNLTLVHGHKALSLASKNNYINLELYGDVLYNIAVAKYRFGEIDSTFFYSEAALVQRERILNPNHPKIIQNINALGLFYRAIGDLTQCVKYQEKALNLALNRDTLDYNSLVISHFYVGNSYAAINNLQLAKKHYLEGLRYYEDSLITKGVYKAHLYSSLGVVLAKQKDIECSQEHYIEALKIFKELQPDAYTTIATTYSNIANNYTNLGEYNKAKEFHRKSINLISSKGLENELQWKYFNLGATYLETKEYTEALEYLSKSKQLNNKFSGSENELNSMILNHIAMVHLANNNNAEARKELIKSSDNSLNIHGEKDYDLSESYYLFGLSHFQDHEYTSCIHYLEKAQNALTDSLQYDFKGEIISRPLLLSIYVLKNKVLLEQHNSTSELKYLHQLYESSINTSNLSEVIIDYYYHESAKLSLFNEIDENLHLGIQASKKLFDLTGDSKYIQQAYNFFEAEKSFLLKREIQDSYAKKNTNLPDSLTSKEDQLKRDISHHQNLIFIEADSESDFSKEINSKVFSLKRELESLLTKIETDYPSYYSLKYRNTPNTLESIQNDLLVESMAIEYYQHKDQIYSISITKDKLKFLYNSSEKFQEKVIEFNKSIEASNLETYSSLAFELHTTLLASHDYENYKDIQLIPSKDISFLSFDALVSTKSDSPSYNELNYLVKTHSFCYNNSLQKNSNETDKSTKLYLGISPSFSSNNLSGAISEVENISEKLDGDLLINNNATKEKLLEVIPNYRVLHLASHAELNASNSAYSNIILASGSEDTLNSKLYAYEIHNSKLNAELVILSACNTGVGELLLGEGIASLARSFNYAGAKSVLVSLWAIPDYSTSKIINIFFDNLNTQSKSRALQTAKIDYLNTADEHLSNPIYWAGLTINGDDSPIIIEDEMELKLLYLILGILTVIGALFWRKNV